MSTYFNLIQTIENLTKVFNTMLGMLFNRFDSATFENTKSMSVWYYWLYLKIYFCGTVCKSIIVGFFYLFYLKTVLALVENLIKKVRS